MLLVWLVHSFLKLPKTDISENLKFSARTSVFPMDSDGPARIESEQEDDQNENERGEIHGLFATLKDHQGENGEEYAEQWACDGKPKRNIPA
jgi:hypothetical protein